MPVQTTKARFNINASLAKHAADDTQEPQDFSRLPCGDYSGVARLITAKLGTYKADAKGGLANQKFLRLAATVVEPDAVTEIIKELVTDSGGRPVLTAGKPSIRILSTKERSIRGLQTSVMFPLCDTLKADGTPVPADEHIADAMNQLRLLAGDEFTVGIESLEALEAKLLALEEVKPFFKFSVNTGDPTVKYPTPRPFEKWFRGIPDYVAGANYASNGHIGAATDVLDNTAAGAGTPAEYNSGPTGTEPGASPSFSEAGTPKELAAAAEVGDDGAMAELTRLAMAAGMDQEAVDGADSWTALAADITAASSSETAAAEDQATGEPEEFLPKKEEIYFYKPYDVKTKKAAKKAVECEVLTVNEKTKTVTLKNLETGKQVIDLKTKKPLAVAFNSLEVEG